MEETKTFFFLFPLILTLLQITRSEDLVQKICQQAQNKPSCIKTFNANPDSKKANLRQLGIIALKFAAKDATDSSKYIEKALNGTNLGPEVQQDLSDCLEQYINANEQIDNSVAALLSKADKDIRTWLNAALAGIKSCDDGFGNLKSDIVSALRKKNSDFKQLCNNALVVSKLLSEQKKELVLFL